MVDATFRPNKSCEVKFRKLKNTKHLNETLQNITNTVKTSQKEKNIKENITRKHRNRLAGNFDVLVNSAVYERG